MCDSHGCVAPNRCCFLPDTTPDPTCARCVDWAYFGAHHGSGVGAGGAANSEGASAPVRECVADAACAGCGVAIGCARPVVVSSATTVTTSNPLVATDGAADSAAAAAASAAADDATSADAADAAFDAAVTPHDPNAVAKTAFSQPRTAPTDAGVLATAALPSMGGEAAGGSPSSDASPWILYVPQGDAPGPDPRQSVAAPAIGIIDGPLGKMSTAAQRWPLSTAAALIVVGAAGVVVWCSCSGSRNVGGTAAGYEPCRDGDVADYRANPQEWRRRDNGRHRVDTRSLGDGWRPALPASRDVTVV